MLNTVARKVLLEKVIFKRKPDSSDVESHVDIWRKSCSGGSTVTQGSVSGVDKEPRGAWCGGKRGADVEGIRN